MVAFAPVAEPSALRLAGWPEQSRRLPASPGVRSPRYIDAPVCRDEDKNSDGDCTDAATGIQGSNSGDEHLYYCQDGNYNTTGLYHVRHRMYHPTLGRWIQRDPIGYADGMSLYEYAGSSPVGGVDPSGLMLPFLPFGCGKLKAPPPVKWKVLPQNRRDLLGNPVPEYVPHQQLDQQNQDADPENDRYGTTDKHLESNIDVSGRFRGPQPGCCLCWFGPAGVEVTLHYKVALTEQLRNMPASIRKFVWNHESGHVSEDMTDVFQDSQYQEALDKEVSEHNSEEEAYKLTAPTRPGCLALCQSSLWQVVRDLVKPMEKEMERRGDMRDAREYPQFREMMQSWRRESGGR